MIAKALGEVAYFLITVTSYGRQPPLPGEVWSRANAGLKSGPDIGVLVGAIICRQGKG